jgi:hypothetical protein
MGKLPLWRTVGLPAAIVVGLMAAGNAVSMTSATESGVRLGEERAAAATGATELNLKAFAFRQGVFSQSMDLTFVTGWFQPDAEVAVTLSRPVFFLPWRLESQRTRVQPEEIYSL